MRKLRRNEMCYCGSGKKYKKCCLKLDSERNRKESYEKNFTTGWKVANDSQGKIGFNKAINLVKKKRHSFVASNTDLVYDLFLDEEFGHWNEEGRNFMTIREQANFNRVAIELTEVLVTFSEYMWNANIDFTKDNMRKWFKDCIVKYDACNLGSKRKGFYRIMNESDYNSFENFIRIFFENKSRNLNEIESYYSGDRVITNDAETWHLHKLQKEVLRKSFIFGENIEVNYEKSFNLAQQDIARKEDRYMLIDDMFKSNQLAYSYNS